MAELKTGDKAPAFTLLDQDGNTVKLSGFKGRKVLVYFYPKADTPGCTTQACGLRDIARRRSATPPCIGISPDKPAKQKKFDDKYGLGFPLLADADHAVAEAYGVWGEKSMYGKKYMGILRSAFLIDEKGKIAQAWYKVSPKDTPTNLLEGARRSDVDALPKPVDVLSAPAAVPVRRRGRRRSCPGESAAGPWRLTGDEWFFPGHFPGRPDAARACSWARRSPSSARSPCSPTSGSPASCRCSAGSTRPGSAVRSCRATRSSSRSSWRGCRRRAGKGSGQASVNGEVACEAELLFVVVDAG